MAPVVDIDQMPGTWTAEPMTKVGTTLTVVAVAKRPSTVEVAVALLAQIAVFPRAG